MTNQDAYHWNLRNFGIPTLFDKLMEAQAKPELSQVLRMFHSPVVQIYGRFHTSIVIDRMYKSR